jgi:excisionase family DNA binding protein
VSKPPTRTRRPTDQRAIRQPLNGAPEANQRRLVLTVPQVAAELQIPASTVYDLIRRGEIPSVRVGKRIRVPKRRLEDWINGRQAGAAYDARHG